MPRLKRTQIVVFILIVIILYVVTQIVPIIVAKATPTATIEPGTLHVEEDTTGYLIRSETVYVASEKGDVSYKVSEGDQIKKGSQVITFEKDTSDSEKTNKFEDLTKRIGDDKVNENVTNANRKGVFSTYIDGYEAYFTKDNFKKMTKDSVSKKAGKMEEVKSKYAVKDQPLYKIADQSKWYIVCWVDGKNESRYEEGNSVTVRFEDDEQTDTKFYIEAIEKDDDSYKLLLSCDRYYKKFASTRDVAIKLITTDIDGIIIKNTYITRKDGKSGVYVVQTTGENKFVQIKSLATDGTNTVVAENLFYDEEGQMVETVKDYDEILKNPE